jgi:hypothetical protein
MPVYDCTPSATAHSSSDEVVLDIDVLGTAVVDGVVHEIDRARVVLKHRRSAVRCGMHKAEKLA